MGEKIKKMKKTPKICLFFLFFLFVLSFSQNNSDTDYWCSGRRCKVQCDSISIQNYSFTSENCRCNTSFCSGSDCMCPTFKFIPAKYRLDDIPQFVTLKLYGSATRDFFERTNIIDKIFTNEDILDRMNCTIKPTFYVQSDYSDFPYIEYLQLKGNLGLYSITGKLTGQSSLKHWIMEYQKEAEIIKNMTISDSTSYTMSRAVNRGCKNYYDMMKKNKYNLDSTIYYNPKKKTKAEGNYHYWPYTLDYGFHDIGFCLKDECIDTSYKDIWIFINPILYDQEGNDFDLSTIKDEKTLEKALIIFKSNFDENYAYGRAPFGLSVSQEWFYSDNSTLNEYRMDFLIEAYKYMGSQPNSVFVTEDLVLKWIKAPKKFIDLKTSLDYACNYKLFKYDQIFYENDNKGRSPILCDYPTYKGDFLTNKQKCPDYYPNITNSFCGDENALKTKEEVCHYGLDDFKCSYCIYDLVESNSDFDTNGTSLKYRDYHPGNIFFNTTEEWETGLCGVIIFQNVLNTRPRSAIITLKLIKLHLTHLWGMGNYIRVPEESFEKGKTIFDRNSEIYHIVPNYFDFEFKKQYANIGFCARKGDPFFREFIRLGIEFSNFYPRFKNMTEVSPLRCGNNKEDEDENGKKNISLKCECDFLPDNLDFLLFRQKLYYIYGFYILVVFLVLCH